MTNKINLVQLAETIDNIKFTIEEKSGERIYAEDGLAEELNDYFDMINLKLLKKQFELDTEIDVNGTNMSITEIKLKIEALKNIIINRIEENVVVSSLQTIFELYNSLVIILAENLPLMEVSLPEEEKVDKNQIKLPI